MAKKYNVHICEMYTKDIVVTAESEDEAIDKAEDMCCNGVIKTEDLLYADRNIEVIREVTK